MTLADASSRSGERPHPQECQRCDRTLVATLRTRSRGSPRTGSVIAYECAHLLEYPLPLLVTFGSPLGLRTIVTDRLNPPPSFPQKVAVWLNVANREDVVAAEPDLRPLFARDLPAPSRFPGV